MKKNIDQKVIDQKAKEKAKKEKERAKKLAAKEKAKAKKAKEKIKTPKASAIKPDVKDCVEMTPKLAAKLMSNVLNDIACEIANTKEEKRDKKIAKFSKLGYDIEYLENDLIVTFNHSAIQIGVRSDETATSTEEQPTEMDKVQPNENVISTEPVIAEKSMIDNTIVEEELNNNTDNSTSDDINESEIINAEYNDNEDEFMELPEDDHRYDDEEDEDKVDYRRDYFEDEDTMSDFE
jgi:hypothetical protein